MTKGTFDSRSTHYSMLVGIFLLLSPSGADVLNSSCLEGEFRAVGFVLEERFRSQNGELTMDSIDDSAQITLPSEVTRSPETRPIQEWQYRYVWEAAGQAEATGWQSLGQDSEGNAVSSTAIQPGNQAQIRSAHGDGVLSRVSIEYRGRYKGNKDPDFIRYAVPVNIKPE